MKYKHSATDWQIALDEDFTQIIDESLNDTVNLLEWHSPLPRLDDPTKFYSDEDLIYARARVWFDYENSGWLILTDNQNYQEVILTEDNEEDIYTNSEVINMQ